MVSTLTQPILANLKLLPYGGAEPVVDFQLETKVQEIIKTNSHRLQEKSIQHEFLETYLHWIQSTKLNVVQGFDQFPISAVSQGTTESFDKFYLAHHDRRFRCFRGEYMYHPASWKNYFNWAYLDSEPLAANDAIVISHPFSNTGNQHPEFENILDKAHDLGVPVLVDCAFFGIVGGVTFDFNHPAIHTITFSLSKSFPVAHLRIGIRFTRRDDDDALLVNNKTMYINRMSCLVGQALMHTFDADYNFNRFRENQITMCAMLGINPSNTVIFGLDTENKYPEYNRNTKENRLCLSRYLKSGTLPNG